MNWTEFGIAVLLANILLRPLAYSINRQPIKNTEVEVCYRCSIICRSEDEVHVRVLLLQAVNYPSLMLRGLQSQDMDNPAKIEVKAELFTIDRQDILLEQIVSRLSLEPGVSAVSWQIVPDIQNESLLISE